MTSPMPTALHRTSVAEEVAGSLRRRIVGGDLRDGDLLPKQDDLLARYQVGRTTLRQALRILENEGLITVRRGNTGGAVVHVPQATDAARTFGLVLQARQVPLADLAMALRHLEPVCAGLCAERPDRAEQVVPTLHEALRCDTGSLESFLVANRRFHEGLVGLCGNETMRILLGSIESLWSAQEPDWVVEQATLPAGDDQRAAAQRAHHAIVRRIEAGDADGAYRLTKQHVETAQTFPLRPAARPRTVEVLDPLHGQPRLT